MEKLELDYYYGKEAEQFTFYRLPKVLITDSRFKNISSITPRRSRLLINTENPDSAKSSMKNTVRNFNFTRLQKKPSTL